MSFDEKRAWSYLLGVAVAYAGYLAVLLARMRGVAVDAVAYRALMLGSIGVSVGVSVLGSIAAAVSAPSEADTRDERDASIYRYGDMVGFVTLSIAALGALALAMVRADPFWIANALYLAFVVAALVSTGVKLFAYRRGLPPW
jgi:hypothetical protein